MSPSFKDTERTNYDERYQSAAYYRDVKIITSSQRGCVIRVFDLKRDPYERHNLVKNDNCKVNFHDYNIMKIEELIDKNTAKSHCETIANDNNNELIMPNISTIKNRDSTSLNESDSKNKANNTAAGNVRNKVGSILDNYNKLLSNNFGVLSATRHRNLRHEILNDTSISFNIKNRKLLSNNLDNMKNISSRGSDNVIFKRGLNMDKNSRISACMTRYNTHIVSKILYMMPR